MPSEAVVLTKADLLAPIQQVANVSSSIDKINNLLQSLNQIMDNPLVNKSISGIFEKLGFVKKEQPMQPINTVPVGTPITSTPAPIPVIQINQTPEELYKMILGGVDMLVKTGSSELTLKQFEDDMIAKKETYISVLSQYLGGKK